MRTIEADCLVVGAGATAMAFVDTLITETAAERLYCEAIERLGRTPLRPDLANASPQADQRSPRRKTTSPIAP